MREAHLQAVEESGERAGSGEGDAIFLLDAFRQTVAAMRLGVKAFGSKEENGEIRGGGNFDVFGADVFRAIVNAALEFFQCGFDRYGVCPVGSVEQPLIRFDREFGIDGKPDLILVESIAGEFQCEFDSLAGAGGRDVFFRIAQERQDLFEEAAELDFAPGAADAHVGEDAAEVAHAGGKDLHLAEAAMHLFPVALRLV